MLCWPAEEGGRQNRQNPGAASYAATPLIPGVGEPFNIFFHKRKPMNNIILLVLLKNLIFRVYSAKPLVKFL